ncbi:hypothetical protein TNCV_1159461 [Trichonephila clavipes]|nr:hypothetical protein TNCV_1159461 [Trichonephila clavipes]
MYSARAAWGHSKQPSSHKSSSEIGELKWKDPDHLQGALSQNWIGTEPNHLVTCMVLKATAKQHAYI